VAARRTTLALGALVLMTSLVAAPAFAAEPTVSEAELATARALFEEGLAREDAKDWNGALERFKRVAEIRVTAQVLYNMALCYERLGKTASADTFYARVIEKGGAPDLVKLATARRSELKKQIPEVVFEAPPELTLTLDGDAATAGTAIAIDPGKHEVVAHKGLDSARKTFDAPATNAKITIAVPVPVSAPPPPPPPEERHFPVLAIVTGGLALAGAGVGIYGALARSSTMGDLDKVCGAARDQCPDDAATHDDVDKVKTLTTVTNIGFAVAIVATVVTAGIVYFGFLRSKPSPNAGGIPPLLGPIRF
jgi:hypothetical protein